MRGGVTRHDPETDDGIFRLGVNYWPARTAMYWWNDVRPAETDRDMARIAELGLQEARIFLLWEAFQPRPDRVSDEALVSLETVLGSAERQGVGLVLSLFCGHMSGANWLPGWVVDPTASAIFRTLSRGRVVSGAARDIYADAALLDAQRVLAERLASRFAGHPALARWDLGNEFSNLRWPADPDQIARWSTLLTTALAPAGVPVTGGLHSQDLEEDRRIRLSSIAGPWREVAMHGYPAADDPDWVPFLSATAARMAGKPVEAQEFGLSDHELGEDRVARYADRVLRRLWRTGAVGAAWWCFSDYEPALAGLPPFDRAAHELHFGLVRADGSPKPVADVWRHFGRRAVLAAPSFDGPDERTWYQGLPQTLETAYVGWRDAWSDDDRLPV
jgi:endo-1,4-beta-mannosidase